MDVLTGTEVKVAVVLNTDGYTMDEYDFSARFYVSPSCVVTLTKRQMVRFDADTYYAVVDTKGMASGNLRMTVTADIPDSDCDDGLRHEVVEAFVCDADGEVIRLKRG